jgi:hypothetical protein
MTNTILCSSREARDGCLKTPMDQGMMDQGMAAGYNRLDDLLRSLGSR